MTMARERPGRWVVWDRDGSQCCGVRRIEVYPSHLTHIECECGAWIETPRDGPDGERIVERGYVHN